jgi:hypothetical protein
MNRILWLLCLALLYRNSNADDFPTDDDYIDNTNINIYLFNTSKDCITNNNTLYNYKTTFEYICECISQSKCFNNLLNSSKFNKLNFKYNDSIIYLNKLNFTKQCQKYEQYYIFHDIEIYTFCTSLTIFYVFIVLLLLVCSISFINYKFGSSQYTKINNKVPPDYDAIN